MHNFLKKLIVGISSFLPLVSVAASAPRDFKGLVEILRDLMSTLILIVFALTFLTFMWGVIKGWVIHGGDAEGVEDGKNVVVVGVIALTIMSAIWGILYMLQSSFFG